MAEASLRYMASSHYSWGVRAPDIDGLVIETSRVDTGHRLELTFYHANVSHMRANLRDIPDLGWSADRSSRPTAVSRMQTSAQASRSSQDSGQRSTSQSLRGLRRGIPRQGRDRRQAAMALWASILSPVLAVRSAQHIHVAAGANGLSPTGPNSTQEAQREDISVAQETSAA